MSNCGDFSHQLIDPRDPGTWDDIKIVRCTIVSLHPEDNTVDVLLGATPPDSVPAGELTDIDCPDIPMFEGDTWVENDSRRQFNRVPIYYHCQKSSGTIAELALGHMAFKHPYAELTHPPDSTTAVTTRHIEILREKVALAFFPPTAEEITQGIPGSRYVFGHTDRNDLAPCVSEYVCVRMIKSFDYSDTIPDPELPGEYMANPEFGFAEDNSLVILDIIDPILGKRYRGLEDGGITFPCSAKKIFDCIAIKDPDNPTDLAFLNKFAEMHPLYSEGFCFTAPNAGTTFFEAQHYNTYPKPSRVAWVSHYFDQYLQCDIPTDPNNMVVPWDICDLMDYSGTWKMQRVVRSYPHYLNGTFYTAVSYIAGETISVLETIPTSDSAKTYEPEYPYSLRSQHDWNRTVITGMISKPYALSGFYSGIDGQANYAVISSIVYSTLDWDYPDALIFHAGYADFAYSFFVPWEINCWHTSSFHSEWTSESQDGYPNSYSMHYSGTPNVTNITNNPSQVAHGCMAIRGNKGTYGIGATLYFTGGYTVNYDIGETPVIGSDITKLVAKTIVGYNPKLYTSSPITDANITNIKTLPGAATFMDSVFLGMGLLFVEAYKLYGPSDHYEVPVMNMSAFIINLTE